MKKIMKLEGSIPVIYLKEGRHIIAYSPALDLSTCGLTIEKAQSRFKDAMEVFFEELIGAGTLHVVLKELGWARTPLGLMPPQFVARKNERVSKTFAV